MAASRSGLLSLLPEDPAGRIATRSAGVALFEAEFTLRDDTAAFGLSLGPAPAGARFLLRSATTRGPSPTRRFSCELRYLNDDAFRRAADYLLRESSARAALEEAVFEARMLRLVEPVVQSARRIETLARDLWEAGFRVGFGPSWSPAAGGSTAVGAAGKESEMAAFARGHPFWCEADVAWGRRLDLGRASG